MERPLCPLCNQRHARDESHLNEARRETVETLFLEFGQLRVLKPDLSLELFMADFLLNAISEGQRKVVEPRKMSIEDTEAFVMGQIVGVLKVYWDLRKIVEES